MTRGLLGGAWPPRMLAGDDVSDHVTHSNSNWGTRTRTWDWNSVLELELWTRTCSRTRTRTRTLYAKNAKNLLYAVCRLEWFLVRSLLDFQVTFAYIVRLPENLYITLPLRKPRSAPTFTDSVTSGDRRLLFQALWSIKSRKIECSSGVVWHLVRGAYCSRACDPSKDGNRM